MAEKDPDCVFCKIVAGEIPGEQVYEDVHVLAFMDIQPISRGHTLVIPKAHYDGLLSAPVETLEQLVAALPKVARAVVAATGAAGFNILQSNGPCAGQVVPHVHFHVVPRREGDGIGLGSRQSPVVEDDLKQTAEAIRSAL